MEYIDTHCHLDFSIFDKDRESVIARSLKLNTRLFVVPGVTEDRWGKIIMLSRSTHSIAPALGIHPCFLDGISSDSMKRLDETLNTAPGIVAVGETGLDFFINDFDEQRQTQFFLDQIGIAKSHDLPLILHVRKAHDQVTKYLRMKNFANGGFVHCYSGSLQQAKKYLDQGFKLGIGGVITYERSTRLHKIVETLPLTSFVLETDAPDIPLCGREHTRNSPEYLVEVFDAFCRHRKESPEVIADQLILNSTLTLKTLEDYCV